MVYNIGDPVIVNVGNKKLNGIILNINENIFTIIYVGKNDYGAAFAITDNFTEKDIIVVE
jgi:hypothetical protein